MASKFKLFGLTGTAGCGKDTAAAHICARYSMKRIAFADPLKDAADTMLGFPKDNWRGISAEYKNMLIPGRTYTWRHFWQKLGTEVGRNIDENIWLRTAELAIDEAERQGYNGAVITDVRFENESQLIRKRRGLVVHVFRPGLVVMNHASEAGVAMESYDYVLNNTSTINYLYDAVTMMVDKELAK